MAAPLYWRWLWANIQKIDGTCLRRLFQQETLAEHYLNKFESQMSQSPSTCTQHKCSGGTAIQQHRGCLGHVIEMLEFRA